MFLKLMLLFTVIPLIELTLLVKVGAHFGVFTTILIVLGTGALGAHLAKEQGVHVWTRIQDSMKRGEFPAEDMLDGFLILVAGVVLITPGLLTDLTGFIILFPKTRLFIKKLLKDRLGNMMKSGRTNFSDIAYKEKDKI